MNKKQYEEIINYTKSLGVDFVELYYEEQASKNYILNDSKLEDIKGTLSKGLGIRIFHNNNVYYTSTNNLQIKNILKEIDILVSNIKNINKTNSNITLDDEELLLPKIKIEHK